MRARIKKSPTGMSRTNCKNEPNANPKNNEFRRNAGKSKLRPRRKAGPQLPHAFRRQAGVMFSACGPFWPCVTSKFTF